MGQRLSSKNSYKKRGVEHQLLLADVLDSRFKIRAYVVPWDLVDGV